MEQVIVQLSSETGEDMSSKKALVRELVTKVLEEQAI